MFLSYPEKKDVKEILHTSKLKSLELINSIGNDTDRNMLIKGDNFDVMNALLHTHNMAKKIDLVYIDPPFATNNIFKYNKARTSTISSCNDDHVAYQDTVTGAEFIEFLRERLVILREMMSDHSSIYLHIDYKIGHYVKVIMDEIFGHQNFRNDITRIKCNPKNFERKGYDNQKDMILFYTKTDDFIWNEPKLPFKEEEIIRLYKKIDKNGLRYTTVPLHAPGETKNGESGQEWKGLKPPKGRHWRFDVETLNRLDEENLIEWSSSGNPRKIVYADEARKKGKRIQDIWEFKDKPYPSYPTEKNTDLLRTIIQTSSDKEQIVFDCFCGSGTTLVAAQELNRRWIGIDNSDIAIATTQERLNLCNDLFSEVSYAYMTINEH